MIAELVWDVGAELGESPCWLSAEQALVFVDTSGRRLHRYTPATGQRESWTTPEPFHWVVAGPPGSLVVGLKQAIAYYDPASRTLGPIAEIGPAPPGFSLNDAKVAPDGSIWFATMDEKEARPLGGLFRLAGARVERMDQSPFIIGNGPAFSRDGRTIHISDTLAGKIRRYRVDAHEIAAAEPFISFSDDDGLPDGMTVDAQDHLWVAHWGGGKVSRWHRDGRRVAEYPVGTAHVTSCAFGGPALDTLYITTASGSGTEFAGGLYRLRTGVRGIAGSTADLPGFSARLQGRTAQCSASQ